MNHVWMTAVMMALGMMAAGTLPRTAWADEAKKEGCADCACEGDRPVPAALNFTMKSITGEEVALAKYHGKVVLVVNVASRCGHTKQYADLQALHEKYAERGLAILGFPCNQFGGQEPGTEEEIAAFCSKNYGVTFDLFEKIDVKGNSAAPLFAYLTGEESPLADKGDVKWNFEKFLIDREGTPIARFRSKVKPSSEDVVSAIEKALGPAAASEPVAAAE